MANNPPYPLHNDQSIADAVSDAASQAKDKVNEMTSQAREKASALGRAAVEKMDSSRESAAESLQSTASSLRSGAEIGSQSINNFASRAAGSIEQTAQYMREHNVRGMVSDVQEMVKRNPGPSLIAAAAFGFLLGAALRRD
ncbi:MAG TPA: hypothetical protein VMZ52_14515 [Bryobacteraceae bacterium]|nr:hypothetical protein [Bryobacteraceae bacterium]